MPAATYPKDIFFTAPSRMSNSGRSFDAVTAFYVMNHVPRPSLCDADPHRFLAETGWSVLASFGGEASEWDGEWLGVRMGYSHHAPEMTRQIVEDAEL